MDPLPDALHLRKSHPRRSLAARAGALLIALLAALVVVPAGPAAASADCPAGAEVNVIAHPDDDLFFMNPDVQDAVAAGTCVRTVYVTSGDAGQATWYWQSREAGVQAAYAQMAGVASTWTTATRTFGPATATVRTLAGSRVSLVFLRVPDGGLEGDGTSTWGGASLQKLWRGQIASVPRVDGSAALTRDQLVQSLEALLVDQGADTIRTMDLQGELGDGDHSDHYATADFTHYARTLAAPTVTLTGYYGYPVAALSENLTQAQVDAKVATFLTYAPYDRAECQSAAACLGSYEGDWLRSRHTMSAPAGDGAPPTTTPTDPGEDPGAGRPSLTASATASASSAAGGQPASAAVDGSVDGYPGNWQAEWASNGEGTGAWWQLTWPSAVTVDRIVLHDRPNTDDRITGGTLTFSDGTTTTVPALADDGSATVVDVGSRSVTSLRLTVTSTSASTLNVGLAEVEVYGPVATTTPTTPSTPSGSLLSRGASVTVSSQASGQPGSAAVDGVVDGYPGNWQAEWATAGEGAGAWLELTAPVAVTVTGVVLHDRPNGDDRITGGTLTFSDGSTVTVPALADDGSATVVTFPARTVTSVRFTVTSVSASTLNAGLAEFEVYGWLG
jgi:LmbE family N-acetylglucosaminyl deacetylase